jgi:nucleoredoxin
MRRLFPLVLLLGAVALSVGAQLPLTSKEVSLMLRSGYSNPTVMQELARRHFADTLDADKETALLKAGASDDLLNSLKSGVYAVPAQESAAIKEQLARQSIRSSLQADRARKADSAFQAKVARERNARATAPLAAATNFLYDAVKGDLVRCNNGTVVHADDEAVADKKLIALYFSAHWCGPCRSFTPSLVEFYNRVAQQHPEFEVIFVSADRSDFAMQQYMREANMPWPAIDFAKVPEKESIRKYCGSGIPCLVVLDSAGKVLSDSYAGAKYRGPQKVLAELETMLAGSPGAGVAQAR